MKTTNLLSLNLQFRRGSLKYCLMWVPENCCSRAHRLGETADLCMEKLSVDGAVLGPCALPSVFMLHMHP